MLSRPTAGHCPRRHSARTLFPNHTDPTQVQAPRRPQRSRTLEQRLTHRVETIAAQQAGSRRWGPPDRRAPAPRSALGGHRLKRLQPEHVEIALNEAVRRGHFARNPVQLAKPPQLAENEVEPLSMDEVRHLLAAALARRNSTRSTLALALGVRKGEALGPSGETSTSIPQPSLLGATQCRPWQHGCEGPCGRERGADCPDLHVAAWS
jgi:hypothetical protein